MSSLPSSLPFRSLVFLFLIFLEPTDQSHFISDCSGGRKLPHVYAARFALPFLCHRLLSAVLRTSEVESRATRASLTELLSPQMGKDIVWFLRRWAKTYLLVDEKLYGQVSYQNEINQCVETAGMMSEWSLQFVSFLAPFKNHAQIPGTEPRHFYVPLYYLWLILWVVVFYFSPSDQYTSQHSIWSGHGGSAVDCGISVGESDQ